MKDLRFGFKLFLHNGLFLRDVLVSHDIEDANISRHVKSLPKNRYTDGSQRRAGLRQRTEDHASGLPLGGIPLRQQRGEEVEQVCMAQDYIRDYFDEKLIWEGGQ
jgi:hypothetical protein